MWARPILLAISLPLLAQTDPHEEEDQIYQERVKQRSEAPPQTNDRESFVAAADRIIRDSPDYKSKTTEHWQVRTDDKSVDVVASTALLESFRTWFESFWKDRLTATPSKELGRVYVFTSFHDYNKLLTGDARHGEFRPAGHYNLYTDVVALNFGTIGPGELPDTLVHEGSHLLVAREILGAQPVPPWLAEGLAVYFESTARDGKGHFETGRIAGRRAKDRVRDFKKLLGTDPPWSAGVFIEVDDPQVFYGDEASGRYGAAWMIVHALFHGEGGKYAPGFARFLEKARAGDPSAEAFYAATGLDTAALTSLVVTHTRAQ